MSDLPEMGTSLESTPQVDRRTLLRRAAAVGVVAVPGYSLLSACATSGSGDNKKSGGGTTSSKNPLGVKEDAPLDVVIFSGGYSDKYATDVHEPMYKKAFPKATIKHESVTEVSKTLQPRYASGTNVPDVVDNSGSGLMEFGALYADKQMADLTPLWDAPSVDDPSKKVRDVVIPGTVEVGMSTTCPPSSASGTPASCSRTRAGRSRRPGPTSSSSVTRSRRRASPRSVSRARTPRTTCGTSS
jgi:N-acetylglucosamine transport system substrate-binding protein